MATPNERLAESLEVLKNLQDQGIIALKSSELKRIHRERLVKAGFLREVVKGWFILTPVQEKQGDSTTWFASYWNFCARYLTDRFGKQYWISADQSLKIHAGSWTVPIQLIVRSPKGTNSKTPLPFETSLFSIETAIPQTADIIVMDGIRMLSLPSSLIHCSQAVYEGNATDVRVALALISDSSQILPLLLDGGHSTIAGRLAGAFRNIGREKIADEIIKAMQSAGYVIRESDPFENPSPVNFSIREKSPYVNRIKLMWHTMRDDIINLFPKSPGISKDIEKYLKNVDNLYVTDAYHSLSIEQYRVTPELIDRVKSGTWDLEKNEEDKKQRDAMAARGYWQATQQVRKSIQQILEGRNAGEVIENDHGDWYRELFAPSVNAGILKPSDLAGYRNNNVYIGQSKHVPLNPDALRDAMPVLFELLRNEPESSVRAVLGHFIFVFIHPYSDGNGRIGRFFMNAMLASGGYPWTVIPVEERATYMQALEAASVDQNIKPFAEFLAYLVSEGMKGTPVANISGK
jgi:hypothetical protein